MNLPTAERSDRTVQCMSVCVHCYPLSKILKQTKTNHSLCQSNCECYETPLSHISMRMIGLHRILGEMQALKGSGHYW